MSSHFMKIICIMNCFYFGGSTGTVLPDDLSQRFFNAYRHIGQNLGTGIMFAGNDTILNGIP